MSTCAEVTDDLAELVAGDRDAIARHSDHIASCDACRDLRHEATELADRLGQAGSDHALPADFTERLMAKLAADASPTAATVATPKAEDAAEEKLAKLAQAMKAEAKADAKTATKASEPTPITAAKPKPRASTGSGAKRPWAAVFAAAAVAAGGAVVYKMKQGGSDEVATVARDGARLPGGAIGKIAQIARAAADGAGGVSIKIGGGDWRVLGKTEALPAGATIKTDERTRVSFDMADGTKLVLDHQTELAFSGSGRKLTLTRGRLSAEVAHQAEAMAIKTPAGTIDVIGTKFVATATEDVTSVQVVRGSIALTTTSGQRDEVHAGEEGLIENGKLSVASAPSLASELAWTELGVKVVADDATTAGLGALRAYKPGEKRDRDWKLALAKHDVKVRIVGPIARTEITETFRNDSDQTLEGVYQFPLPADAQIDGLSLDMKDAPNGFIDGAFLDKNRAQKIWQGVIDKAAPVQIARNESEIIWVPGRWKDPALLDWKRGGRFELKIFPIPAKGARTIKLAYTQVVTARGPFRQYVYPLPHSTDGSTVADTFTADVEVRGSLPGLVRTVGYAFTPDANRKDVNALTLSQSAFVPKGDLVIDYRAVDGDAELRAWTFAGGAAVAPDDKLALKKGVGLDPKVLDAQRAVAADARPTAVLALRPALPRWRETKPRTYTIVVDASQSMVGERFARATEMASALVEQMDRRDQFTLAACDSECRRFGDARTPSPTAAAEAKQWLGAQVVAGASDLVASIRSAAAEAKAQDREQWILYIGDGFASTGFRRAADIERALTEVADRGVRVSTIAIGGDADLATLTAAARGGGGSYLAWVPGQSLSIAALSALESTNGASLRDATVELPPGLADIAPTVLPTMRSGEEILLAARITGDVAGDVIVRGKVGGKPFEQKYPLKLAVSSMAGNGFVPRLWATLAIEQLERRGEAQDRTRTVALSQGYGVMSKETSLLVLESQAMFDAFGVDRSQPTNKWTGEDALDEVVATGSLAVAEDELAKDAKAGSAMNNAGKAKADSAPPAAAPMTETTTTKAPSRANRPRDVAAEKKSFDKTSMSMDDGDGGGGAGMGSFGPGMMDRSNMISYRRTWVRVPAINTYDGVSDGIKKAIANAEAALAANPDSREKHRALVQTLAYAGEIDRARDIAAKWLERDKLDPQALGYQADLLGRDGQRELALRTLAGLVDLDADRVALHERMVRAYEMSGRRAQACAHRIALTAITPKDLNTAGATMRCLRSVGHESDAQLILRALPDDSARATAEKAATVQAIDPKVAGDLVVNARWDGAADLDLTLVTPEGTRVSWMGGRTDVVVGDASSQDKEALAVKQLKKGNYLVEITRGDSSTGPLRGTADITVLGAKKSIPFELLGSRAVVGRINVKLEEKLEQISGFGMVAAPLQPRVQIGGISDPQVRRVVQSRAGALRACYQVELARNPSAQGRLDVAFAIDASGAVSDVMGGGSMSNQTTTCVRAQLARLRFPAAVGAQRLSFPIFFQAVN